MDQFATGFRRTLDEVNNESYTENGALGYKTTRRPLLDLNFIIPSLRSATSSDLYEKFMAAYNEDADLALKWLFYLRDIREGVGERDTFRRIMLMLLNNRKEIALPSVVIEHLISRIPEYGRWDDVVEIFYQYWEEHKPYADDVTDAFCKTIKMQWDDDLLRLGVNDSSEKVKFSISLLAKWLPSPKTGSPGRRCSANADKARLICKALDIDVISYRRALSKMRNHLKVVEAQMSRNRWSQINYAAVPGRANLIYKNAFMFHDSDRRQAFLDALAKGETKINSGTVYPYELVAQVRDTRDPSAILTIEEMWKALPKLVEESTGIIVVADGSGSMFDNKVSSRAYVWDVATALAIYFAEQLQGPFHNSYITFSRSPQMVNFSDWMGIKDKVAIASKHTLAQNTDIEKVFKLILHTGIENNLTQDQMPKVILLLSDMEFDTSTRDSSNSMVQKKLFQEIQELYKQHGYLVPKVVFWNVASRTNTIPMIENPLGVTLLSGFSINLVKMVLSGKLDPWEALVEQLTGERYRSITTDIHEADPDANMQAG